MKDEIAKIIAMVQEGKIDSDEAGELIGALKESNKTTSGSYLNKTFKIKIKSSKKDDVNVNIPIKFVKGLMKMGHGIATSIPQANKYAADIDMNLLMHAIDNEIDGQIVDIQSANGDIVSIIIE